MQRQRGEQPGIARTRPDEPDAARLELRQTKKRAVDHERTICPACKEKPIAT
jgi:hypothetical protein